MNLAKTLTAAATLTLGLALSSCATEVTGEPAPVTLRVGDQVAGTELLLEAAGLLDDLPYDIEWSSFTSGPPQIEALNASQIDFAITGNTPPIVGGPNDTKVIAAYGDSAEGDVLLVAPDSGIREVADLRGRSVAVARGSSAHGHLLQQLDRHGVDLKEVELNLLAPSDAKAAFQNGQVDAWAVWDPYSAQAELEGAEVLTTAVGVSSGYGFGVASDAALADPAKVSALGDLLDRVAEAYTWGTENPERWAEIYAGKSGFDPEAALLNTRSLRVEIALDQQVTENQNALIAAFADAGILQSFDFATIVDTRFEG